MSLTGENIGENTGESGAAAFLIPPSDVDVTDNNHNSITLQWTEPAKGSAIGYRVVESSGGLALASAPYGSGEPDPFILTVENLTPETAYTFYVVTYNTTSESELSNAAQATTSVDPNLAAPVLLSINATEGNNSIQFIYDESTETISSSYIDGFTLRVNATQRGLTYVSGGGGSIHSYTIPITLSGGDDVDLSYLSSSSDLRSVATGIEVENTTLPTHTVPEPQQGVVFFDDFRDKGSRGVGDPPSAATPVIAVGDGRWHGTSADGRELISSDQSLTAGRSLKMIFPWWRRYGRTTILDWWALS